MHQVDVLLSRIRALTLLHGGFNGYLLWDESRSNLLIALKNHILLASNFFNFKERKGAGNKFIRNVPSLISFPQAGYDTSSGRCQTWQILEHKNHLSCSFVWSFLKN